MAKKKYKRDPQDISLALATHTVSGYDVTVRPLGEGTVDKQVIPGHLALFRVDLKEPVPFDRYADMIGADATRVTLDQFEERYGIKLDTLVPEEVLEGFRESGLSKRDFEFYKMSTTGCLDIDQNVTCVVGPWKDVNIVEPKRGQIVEYTEFDPSHVSSIKVWPGRILGVEGNVAYLELFSPLPFMRAPEMIVPEKIKKDYHLPVAWSYGYGLHQALEEQDRKDLIPEGGEWTEDNREYRLTEAVPLEKIKAFCKEHYPDEPHCVWHATTLMVIPIEIGGDGVFHPLREEGAGYYQGEIEVELDDPYV